MKPVALLFGCLLISCMGCRSAKQTTDVATEKAPAPEMRTPDAAMPVAIVYKTKQDFSNYVPVTMDAQHKTIVAYPAPTDVYYKGQLAKPTALQDGYWLDNRGIGEHVAFLGYTYEEYSQLPQAPDMQTMLNSIVERYPLTEMYDCGQRDRFTDEVSELNSLIENGFAGCRQLQLPRPMSVSINLE